LFSVSGKNVLITGGSRDIGLMIAKTFVQAGVNVLLTSRLEDACREAAKEIQSRNYVTSNVSNREGCEALANHVAQVFNHRLDVLINNVSFGVTVYHPTCMHSLHYHEHNVPFFLIINQFISQK
jgi:NAD(P)-dependent dehydrogenase (short-subunit alcohol dehydrogenase family)